MARLCIDFGGTRIKLGLLDGGEVLTSAELAPSDSPADLGAVHSAAADLDPGGAAPEAVGVAMPGVVSDGTLVAAYGKYGWARGVDLGVWARDAFAAPAVVENDARAALVGEASYGVTAGTRDAVLVALGTGIGTSALMADDPVRGRRGHAGILGGHVTVDIDGPACNCGNLGCAEAVASTWALARDAARSPALAAALGGTDPGLKALFERAGDPVARRVLDRYLRVWGAVVVTMCHAYEPEIVVLSGGALRAAEVIVPAIDEYVGAHLWPSVRRPEIVVPAAPEHSVLLGLSALAAHAQHPVSSGRESA